MSKDTEMQDSNNNSGDTNGSTNAPNTVSDKPQKKGTTNGTTAADGKSKKKATDEPELSEEDLALKTDLEMLVERLKEIDTSLYQPAIDQLGTHIRTSTSSMTAVPKPLKFLRPHYQSLQTVYDDWQKQPDLATVRGNLGDVLSVLAMTYADSKRDCLRYRLARPDEDPGTWGHEYVRHLATEIGEERADRIEKEQDTADLLALASKLVPFFLSHNAEADAVDLVLEMEAVDMLVEFVDENTWSKVCLYMTNCVSLLAPPDDVIFLETAHRIYRKQRQWPSAMLLAIRLDQESLMRETLTECDRPDTKKQLAFMLAQQGIWLHDDDADESIDNDDEETTALTEALRNARLSEYFKAATTDLSLADPRTTEDIYKSHLEPSRSVFSTGGVDSAKQNLAATFVNGFVNAGYGTDKMILVDDERSSFVYKNKDAGQASATASIGLLSLWDVDNGLSLIDKYFYAEDEHIKAGALLGVGVMNNGVHHEGDPAIALLSEEAAGSNPKLRTSAIIGLGLAYAGSNRQDIQDLLLELVGDTDVSMEVSSLAALSLGLVFVGSCNGDVASAVLQTLMERDEKQLVGDKWAPFMVLGLALLFVGKQEEADAAIETLKAIENPLAKHAEVLLDMLAYAGTGNVLKVQRMLHLTAEHLTVPEPAADENADGAMEEDDAQPDTPAPTEPDNLFQAFATIGIAAIAMGEDIGTEMALRQFGHLMHYGDPIIRKAVPLALGLLSASNPQMKVFETLSRYSHDADLDVAVNAIFAMGLVGAGTNNARLAQLLRSLASYYAKEPNTLFVVRLAQGLLHLGKGTMSLNPFHFDRSIFSKTALAGLVTVLIAFLDAKRTVLADAHWLLFLMTPALRPRMLITVDEKGDAVPVTVRVGQAVDSFGPGKPRKITGWVTQTTPVLLNYEHRAELATDEYLPATNVLEGVVIVKKNPNYFED
ncbi:proteasome regulatory particle base subunit [Savitreella phatthalungensis]